MQFNTIGKYKECPYYTRMKDIWINELANYIHRRQNMLKYEGAFVRIKDRIMVAKSFKEDIHNLIQENTRKKERNLEERMRVTDDTEISGGMMP
jgi:hypothetical protein